MGCTGSGHGGSSSLEHSNITEHFAQLLEENTKGKAKVSLSLHIWEMIVSQAEQILVEWKGILKII